MMPRLTFRPRLPGNQCRAPLTPLVWSAAVACGCGVGTRIARMRHALMNVGQVSRAGAITLRLRWTRTHSPCVRRCRTPWTTPRTPAGRTCHAWPGRSTPRRGGPEPTSEPLRLSAPGARAGRVREGPLDTPSIGQGPGQRKRVNLLPSCAAGARNCETCARAEGQNGTRAPPVGGGISNLPGNRGVPGRRVSIYPGNAGANG